MIGACCGRALILACLGHGPQLERIEKTLVEVAGRAILRSGNTDSSPIFR